MFCDVIEERSKNKETTYASVNEKSLKIFFYVKKLKDVADRYFNNELNELLQENFTFNDVFSC